MCWSFGIDESDAIFTHPFAFMCVFLLQMSFFAMCVCVDFDAPATGKWYQIERRRVVFLCWMQDSNPGSMEPNLLQTKCPMKNQLSYRGSNKNFEINSSSLWSASISPFDPTTDMASPLALNALRCLPPWNYKWHNVFSRWISGKNYSLSGLTSNKTLRKIL